MITAEMRSEMRRLVLVEHLRIQTVARRFGVHHSVVRRALIEEQPSDPVAPKSALDPFKPYIVRRLIELPELTSVRLLEELRARGLKLGLAQLRRYVAQVRTPRPRKAYLRFEVEPGEQAQVDWGFFGHLRVGTAQRPLSAFSMVLSWSRALFLDFAFDQQFETFCRLHQRALAYFGGVPRRLVYDNLKSVVLHRVGAAVQFNPRFLAFAGHHLFEPVAAPAYYPEYKGRVENSIKYIRQSFFYGRSFSSLEDVRRQAAAWRDQTANERLHGTTRERPSARLVVERARLRALPTHPFDTDVVLPLVVSKEARVHFDTNTYSVPPMLVGKTVHLRADDRAVRVLCDGAEVASHARCWDRRRHLEDPAHVEQLLARRPGARGPRRRDRIERLSPEAKLYIHEIARRRIHLSHEVDKLDRLFDLYGATELAAALAKALGARTFGARYVRALCDQARFARGLGEPPEPIVTGNAHADALDIDPHPMESYDALFPDQPEAGDPSEPQPDADPERDFDGRE